MAAIFIYVTTTDEKEAKKLARHLLNKKLIACANIFPIRSMFRWDGKIQDVPEGVMILKTMKKNYAQIKKEITALHSYTITCITQLSVKPNKEYAAWLRQQL